MTPTILDSVKRPVLVGIVSVVCGAAIALLWVKFPDLVPISVLIVVVFVTGVTFFVSEVITVLKIARMLTPRGPLAREIGKLPGGAFVGLALALVLSNGALLYFYHLRPGLGYVFAVNLAAVVAWLSGRLAAARRVERRTGRRPS